MSESEDMEFENPGATITGVGIGLPEKRIHLSELEEEVKKGGYNSEKSGPYADFCGRKFGTEYVYIAKEEETSDLIAKACNEAMEYSGLNPRDIEMFVMSTITPDNTTAGTRGKVMEKVNLFDIPGYELNHGCIGFIPTLRIAADFVEKYDLNALAGSGDTLRKKRVSDSNFIMAGLIGNGSGGVTIGSCEPGYGVLEFRGRDEFQINPAWFNDAKTDPETGEFVMDGASLKQRVKPKFKKMVHDALEYYGIDPSIERIHLVPHQVNGSLLSDIHPELLQELADKYSSGITDNINMVQFINVVNQYCNCSNGSPPIGLYHALKSGEVQRGDYVFIFGVGAGFDLGIIGFRADRYYGQKKKVHVAVVDDDKTVGGGVARQLAKSLLDTYAHRDPEFDSKIQIVPHFYTNGNDFLIRSQTEGPFAAVIMDYKMPQKDGLETASEFHPKSPETPIFIHSAYIDGTNIGVFNKAHEAGIFEEIINKPFTEEHFKQIKNGIFNYLDRTGQD